MDYSPPGSSVHGILQARILEWVAMPSSRDLPITGIEPKSPSFPALQADYLPAELAGKPLATMGIGQWGALVGDQGRKGGHLDWLPPTT